MSSTENNSPFTRQPTPEDNPMGTLVLQMASYLRKRGLEPSDFPEGLTPSPFDGAALRTAGFEPKMAYERGYLLFTPLDPYGLPHKDNGQTFRIARFLGEPVMHMPTGGWPRGKEPKPAKIVGQKGALNQLHFEPIRAGELTIPWTALKDGDTVLHVESFIKAKAVHKATGMPCIGLNGVTTFGSTQRGAELHLLRYGIDLSRCRHVILYDSNIVKPEVRQAAETYASKLLQLAGVAEVHIAELPEPTPLEDPEGHWGPDDFLVARGATALLKVIEEAPRFEGMARQMALHRLAEKTIFIPPLNAWVDRETKMVMSPGHAKDFYATINSKVIRGRQTVVHEAFVDLRTDQNLRREMPGLAFIYQGEEMIQRDSGDTHYNLYRKAGPWPALGTARNGRAQMVIDHAAAMLGPDNLALFRSWLKYLKFETGKPTSAIVLYGDQQGSGKGMLAAASRLVIGRSLSVEARGDELTGRFNDLLEAKRLLIFHEFGADQAKSTSAKRAFKQVVGDDMLTIEGKGQKTREVDNYSGVMITTNDVSDVPSGGLEDRRVIAMRAHYPGDRTDAAYWRRLWAPIKAMDPDFAMDLAVWAQEGEYIDFASYIPAATEDREEALVAGMHPIAQEAHELLKDWREEGYVCVKLPTVMAVLQRQGGFQFMPSAKVMGEHLRAAGWVDSGRAKRYGSRESKHPAWIIDPERFAAIADHTASVLDEFAKVDQATTQGQKF